MKTLLHLCLLCAITTLINAQPVLTKNITPTLGSSYVAKIIELESFDPGLAGANQTWDFSAIDESTATSLTLNILDPASVTNGPEFEDVDFVYNIQEFDIFNYYRVDQDSLTLIGQANIFDGNVDLLITYSNFEDGIHFPLRFGDAHDYFSRLEKFVYGYSIGIEERNGNTFADAYGTLKTPFGTYSNVMRVKVTVNNNFVIRTNYLWMDANSFIPIMFYEFTNDPVDQSFIYYTNFEQNPSSSHSNYIDLGNHSIYLDENQEIVVDVTHPDIQYPLHIQVADSNGSLFHQEIMEYPRPMHRISLPAGVSKGFKVISLNGKNVKTSKLLVYP